MLRLGLGEKPTSKCQMMCWSEEMGDRESGNFRDNSRGTGFGGLRGPSWGPTNTFAQDAVPGKPCAHPGSRFLAGGASRCWSSGYKRCAVNRVSGAAFVPGSSAEGARTSNEHRRNVKTAPPLRRRMRLPGWEHGDTAYVSPSSLSPPSGES